MKRKVIIIFIVSCVILFFLFFLINLIVCPKRYKNYVLVYAQEYDLEVPLVYAVIKTESDFDRQAVSRSGALGLMQILPTTAKWIAESLGEEYDKARMFDAETNIRYGCFYLRYLFDKFGDQKAVICAYNAGEGKVLDWIDEGGLNDGRIDYGETKRYLKKVSEYYNIYKNNLLNT